jgi:hypothetical protein
MKFCSFMKARVKRGGLICQMPSRLPFITYGLIIELPQEYAIA